MAEENQVRASGSSDAAPHSSPDQRLIGTAPAPWPDEARRPAEGESFSAQEGVQFCTEKIDGIPYATCGCCTVVASAARLCRGV